MPGALEKKYVVHACHEGGGGEGVPKVDLKLRHNFRVEIQFVNPMSRRQKAAGSINIGAGSSC